MPPKTRSSHERIEAAPRQTKISSRRTTLVHKRTLPPKLTKRDSTLTQLGFCHSSSPAVETQWTIPVTSDAEDEDEDYQESRAKKRRKTAGSSARSGGKKAKNDVSESQSTLTQNWRAMGYVMDSYDTSDDEDLMLVDEGMQPPPSAQPKQTRPRPRPRRRPAPDAGETQIQGDNLLGVYLDNDWSSGCELESASKSSLTPSQLAHFARSQERDSTRPTTANSHVTPKTPKRITKTEIPDSAESSSVPTSTRSAKSGPGYARSPLKERSTNVPSQREPPRTSREAAREKISFGQIQLDDANGLKEPIGQWSAKLAFTPKKAQKVFTQPREDQQLDSSPTLSQSTRQQARSSGGTAKKRTFERVSTIAESDDSDVELVDIEQPRFQTSSRQPVPALHPGDNESASNDRVVNSHEEVETLSLPAGHGTAVGSLPISAAHGEMRIDGEAAEEGLEDSPSLSQGDADGNDPPTHRHQDPRDTGVFADKPRMRSAAASASSTLAAGQTFFDCTTAEAQPSNREGPNEAITIGDSEDEAEYGEDDDYTEDDLDGHPYERDDDHDDEQEYPYNQTYDPVADALARDGARAWRTETQLQRAEQDKVKAQEALVEDSDEEGEDNMKDVDIVAVPSSQDEEARVPSSQEFADNGRKLAALGSPGRIAVGDIDDSGYASQEMLVEDTTKALPQTMPPPEKPQQSLPELTRPSQVSTVMDDTQSQRSRRNSAHGISQRWTAESAPSSPPAVDVGLPEDPIERSPQKSHPQTLSSSPLPMPPGVARRARKDYSDTQSSGLMDFSLPPPPPLLLSSSRLNDRSSSR